MFGAEISPLRLAFFLVVGPPLIAWLVLIKSNVLRLFAVVAILILIQDSFSQRRFLWLIGIGPAVIVAYVAFFAFYVRRGGLPALGAYLPLWILLLFLGGTSVAIGALGSGVLATNFLAFQEFYLEALLFFLVGVMAFGRDDEVERFFSLFPAIGIGVAFLHLYFVATGTRLRTYAGEVDQALYGGVFSNPNNLGAFYAIAVPIALVVAVRGRVGAHLRLLALAAIPIMLGSLLLAGSRGGFLTTSVMTLAALLWLRLGLGRAALFVGLGGAVAIGGYVGVSTLFPNLLGEVFGLLAEEGLETGRFSVWGSFLRLIADNPLGVGLSSESVQSHAAAYRLHVVNAHNIYLDFASKSGILSLLVFLIISGSILWRTWRALGATHDPARRQALILPFLAMVGFLIAGVVEPVYYNCYQLAQLFWLSCGMSLAGSARGSPEGAPEGAAAARPVELPAAVGDRWAAP